MKIANVIVCSLLAATSALVGCSTMTNEGAPHFFESEVKSRKWLENQNEMRMVQWSNVKCSSGELVVVGFGKSENQVTCLEFYKEVPRLEIEPQDKFILIGRDYRYDPVIAFRPRVHGKQVDFEITRETPSDMPMRKHRVYTLQCINGKLYPDLSELIWDIK